MHLVCHVVDRMGDTRIRFKCATADIGLLCPAPRPPRAVHVRHPFPVSAHVCPRLEKLRHLASVRLTCMNNVTGIVNYRRINALIVEIISCN